MIKSTDGEKLGNGKWNAPFLFSQDFKKGEAGDGTAGGEGLGTFGVLLMEVADPGKMGSKAGLDQA